MFPAEEKKACLASADNTFYFDVSYQDLPEEQVLQLLREEKGDMKCIMRRDECGGC